MTTQKAIREMKPFYESDWMCYAGCESAVPLIGQIFVTVHDVPEKADIITDAEFVSIIVTSTDIPSDEDTITIKAKDSNKAIKLAQRLPDGLSFDVLNLINFTNN